MFANIFLLSLLTIIYGTKGEEGGGGRENAVNFLPDLSQRSSDDLNFIKTQRSIRTPFRNTEIMTARGFGKRNMEDQRYNENYNERKTNADRQIIDDYRDEAFINRIREKQLLLPYINQFLKNQEESAERESNVISPVKNHRLQIRDGTLKFRLNDGNLRIGRGFGKRSGGDPFVENYRAMKLFQQLSTQNEPPSPLAANSVQNET